MEFSKIIKKFTVVAGFGMLGLMGTDTAEAAPAPGTAQPFTVQASVVGDCTLTTANFNFGAYNYAAGNAPAATNFNVACSAAGISYDVVFDVGLGVGATVAGRRMKNSANADQLVYTLKLGATDISDNPAFATITGTSGAAAVDYPILPAIASLQAVSTGTYNDTVNAAIWY